MPMVLSRRSFLALVTATSLAAQRAKTQVTITEATPSRRDREIRVALAYRNTGERPLEGLQLVLAFLDAGQRVVTERVAELEEAVLGNGEEGFVEAYIHDTPKAVAVRIAAVDRKGREVKVENAGPYPIP